MVAASFKAKWLDLMEAALTGTLYGDPPIDPWTPPIYNELNRSLGRDWPARAQTMIGSARMRSLRQMCESVLDEGVPGDFMECGVWRGGACIYMRAILEAHGDATRRVILADSFKGLPPPSPDYPRDANDTHHTYPQLVVPRSEVEENFRRYGLLDSRVVFLEGWFRDTLQYTPTSALAILRLDGDMYESTYQALDALYPNVSPGGFVIIDDYFLQPCRAAITDYRNLHRISAPIFPIDGMGFWWHVERSPTHANP